jgi:hypothetical protein
VIFEGPPAELLRATGTLTGHHLRRRAAYEAEVTVG